MPYEERNAWSALIAGVITFFIFGTRIWSGTVDGAYVGDAGLSLWAWDVIWLIGGGIGLTIVVVIAFQILYAILTMTPNPQFITDERDTMISRHGSLITLIVSSGGFMVAVVLLATGWTALSALNTILGSMALSGMASEIYRVAVYRFGL
jgi:hypothetical protein